MPQIDEAIARISARVAAAVPPPEQAPPVNPPAEPITPDTSEQRLTDLEATVSDLAARVAELEQAAIEEAIADMDDMGEPGNVASLPEPETAATFDTAQRDKLAKGGEAMPDGSYPIRNQADLEAAVQSLGRASDPEAVKAHIRTRADALGLGDWLKQHAPSVVGEPANA